ncbi:MAG: peptidoglycan DD-metalloendopeptidase family protein [Gammaproteobacteria bacterium]|jgi:septal ring factor EnvC (AmiA/AmiB activator)|nr:peptidoglycan DD-metalloendopeptidase family protein [Gammaproteobacteria bacterium]MDP7419207.1 peptidoglycan DD-metalloendopeptidase family protein [Gammaproteobacteria bacterium]MDP7660359.1 peptidoglycan DD-metalloendopeptidase family protein [Gammaproteobacteria bacterium]
MKLPCIGLLPLVFVLCVAALAADDAPSDAARAERDLVELRERLQQVEQDLGRQSVQRDQAQQELREAERSASGVRLSLNNIDAELTATREEQKILSRRADASRAGLSLQVEKLEQELRRTYILGRDDWLRGVLSQQDPVAIGRQLVYSSYLARESSALAAAVRDDLAVLDATLVSLDKANQRLTGIHARERERLAELELLRRDRSVALVRIEQGIATRSEKLARMRTEMVELQSLVDELTLVLTSLPINDVEPFATARGRLKWPADGQITRRFGQPRAEGRLRWDGVLLAAGAGAEVHAVHHGRIVYADWLQGMGLLVIIEHGGGYLSLYGHNQDIVTEIGDWVTPDTVIAHVGDSGGRASPGLYFEIRKGGKPVDPDGWIQK